MLYRCNQHTASYQPALQYRCAEDLSIGCIYDPGFVWVNRVFFFSGLLVVSKNSSIENSKNSSNSKNGVSFLLALYTTRYHSEVMYEGVSLFERSWCRVTPCFLTIVRLIIVVYFDFLFIIL